MQGGHAGKGAWPGQGRQQQKAQKMHLKEEQPQKGQRVHEERQEPREEAPEEKSAKKSVQA